jgi:hypothetical protein
MSFDLMVVAARRGVGEATARELIERCCASADHVEGDLDERIVAFYEELRAIYPDHPPDDAGAPWASTPLDTGIDHVVMSIVMSADDMVLEVIERLATRHGLVLYDPQNDTVHLPPA